MIQDLKLDSQRWQQEQGRQEAGRGGSPYIRDSKVSRHPDSSLVAYQDSRTHAARQHWGPSESFSQGREREPARTTQSSQYATSEHYTTTPAATPYANSHSGTYPVQHSGYAAAPRTTVDPYAGYAQSGREQPTYATPQAYAGYSHSATRESAYASNPPPPTHGYATPRYFGYFDDQYLVYR